MRHVLKFLQLLSVVFCHSSSMYYRSLTMSASVSASFIISCLMSDSTLVRSVAEYGIYTGCCNSVLARNTLLCCLHFGWKFSDFAHSDINMSDTTLPRRHWGLGTH